MGTGIVWDATYVFTPLLCASLQRVVRAYLPHPLRLARADAAKAILDFQRRCCLQEIDRIRLQQDAVVEKYSWALTRDWIQEIEQEFGELLTYEQELHDFYAACLANETVTSSAQLIFPHPAREISYQKRL